MLHRDDRHLRSLLLTSDSGGVRPPAGLRPATTADLGGVVKLLADASLPVDGVAEAFDGFVVAERGGEIVATGGLVVVGSHALLRSVVCRPDERGRGTGQLLVRCLVAAADERKLASVWLRTESAATFFRRHGFLQTAPDEAPTEVAATDQFQGLCGQCAVTMVRWHDQFA